HYDSSIGLEKNSRTSKGQSVNESDFREQAPHHQKKDTPFWILIPAGEFVMGSRYDNPLAGDDEYPQHKAKIPYAYRIARYPVMNAEFHKFVRITGYNSKVAQVHLLDHPVVNVSWYDAQAYCQWLTSQMRAGGMISKKEIVRLPTEAEWEKAARGEHGKEWPWGDEWDAARCNSGVSGIGVGTTTPAGKYSPQGDSPYGAADMVGNIWEWCQSKYEPYPYHPGDGREALSGGGDRVLRGGSFESYFREDTRCARRDFSLPNNRVVIFGFRVIVSPAP
ncbi:MAG TPA: SUMF1/EgtB/PvdO family nonheme iron enzyme, partial [Anaerolineales bacterium]|nr:SUMF1/EgtB/PvdO family nonheme iron enzyme [Anaerolineales bacterium]